MKGTLPQRLWNSMINSHSILLTSPAIQWWGICWCCLIVDTVKCQFWLKKMQYNPNSLGFMGCLLYWLLRDSTVILLESAEWTVTVTPIIYHLLLNIPWMHLSSPCKYILNISLSIECIKLLSAFKTASTFLRSIIRWSLFLCWPMAIMHGKHRWIPLSSWAEQRVIPHTTNWEPCQSTCD